MSPSHLLSACGHPNLSIASLMNDIIVSDGTLPAKDNSGLINCKRLSTSTVSYTHLDVYKRQDWPVTLVVYPLV